MPLFALEGKRGNLVRAKHALGIKRPKAAQIPRATHNQTQQLDAIIIEGKSIPMSLFLSTTLVCSAQSTVGEQMK